MINLTKSSAAILIVFMALAVSTTSANRAKSSIDAYNHILKKYTLNIEHGSAVQIREILFAPGWKAPRAGAPHLL
jgi:hypothetical protein